MKIEFQIYFRFLLYQTKLAQDPDVYDYTSTSVGFFFHYQEFSILIILNCYPK